MRKYDYLIVGAGISGATFAQIAMENGKRCLVLDRRKHLAGNCYTENRDGIHVHMYGPHLFHTNDKNIWAYVQRFANFNGYRHKVNAHTGQKIVPLPINLNTLSALLGIDRPEEARYYFETVREEAGDPNTVEGWCLRNIGRFLYETLVEGYTIKQWDRHPSQLPASIIKRLPFRTVYNNAYFDDEFQGIPVHGYTAMVQKMLDGIDVELGVDFLADIRYHKERAHKVVYTGPIDELFNYERGKLPYRSIRLEHEHINVSDYQGIGQMNFTSLAFPYTRIVEHKHFAPIDTKFTVITREYSTSQGEPYYPINTPENNDLAAAYGRRARVLGYILCGRMARYQYLDMHQAIGQAMKTAGDELAHGD